MAQTSLADLITSWAKNANLFVKECIGATPSRQQRELLSLVTRMVLAKEKFYYVPAKCSAAEVELAKKMGISVMSAKGVGKDCAAAWIILWFMVCYPRAKIPCTAPSGHQLNDVLWAEIRKWIHQANKINSGLMDDLITWYAETVRTSDGMGMAMARTCRTTGSAEEQAETLAGKHEDYMMVVVDEASGVPDAVFRPLETTLTGLCNFALIIFNPTRTTGFAIDSQYKHRDMWCCLQWSALESENVTNTQIERMRAKYGENSNMYRIAVLGLPPIADDDAIIPLEWVLRAVNREDIYVADGARRKAGGDVGAGVDPTIFLVRKGKRVEHISEFSDVNTMTTAMWIAGQIADSRPQMYLGDIVGVGQGVHDRLKELGTGIPCIGVKGSNSSRKPEQFVSLIDELWWLMRQDFENGTISIPDDDELVTELSNRKYAKDMRGKIKIESKLDMKKRGVRSPNKADALALTYFMQDESYDSEEARRARDQYDEAFEKHDRTKEGTSWMAA